MVNVYCHDHTTDAGYDCHLGSEHAPAPHQKELFKRILEMSREELPEEYRVEQTSTSGFKVVDEQEGMVVFVNYYESDTGYRVKIDPRRDEFFEKVFRPMVEEIPVPDEIDTLFKWKAFLFEEGAEQSCTICGKMIEGGEPILAIKSPYQVQAGEIVEEKIRRGSDRL